MNERKAGRKNIPNNVVCRSFSMEFAPDGITVEGRASIPDEDMEKWQSVIKVCSGSDHVIGLCRDGTVLAVGNNQFGQCNVSEWKNIVSIQSGDTFSLGVDEEGEIFFSGISNPVRNDAFYYQQFITKDWQQTDTPDHAAVVTESNEEYEYEIKNNAVCITKYKGNASELALPDTLNGKPVTEIGLKSFENCHQLVSVIIPECVQRIGAFAFKGCTALKRVLLPSDISEIGDGVFWECKNVVICCDNTQYAADYCRANSLPYASDAIEKFISLKYRNPMSEHIDYVSCAKDMAVGNTSDKLISKTNLWITSELSDRGLTPETIQQQDVLLFVNHEQENPVHNLIYILQKVTVCSETENTSPFSYYTYTAFSNVGMTEKKTMNADNAAMQTCRHSQSTQMYEYKGNVSLDEIKQAVRQSVEQSMGTHYTEKSLIQPDKDNFFERWQQLEKLRTGLQDIQQKLDTLKQELFRRGMKECVLTERILTVYKYLWEADLVADMNNTFCPTEIIPDYDICLAVYNACPKLRDVRLDCQFHSLEKTKCHFSPYTINGQTINLYGDPIALNETLIHVQGRSLYPMSGTCGLCQSANLMTMAGQPSCEERAISTALHGSNEILSMMNIFDRYSCNRGGTSSAGREELLKSCGLATYQLKISDKKKAVADMYELLIQGHGIIISVDVKYLWRNGQSGGHALSLISVSEDGKTFVYNDTGAGVMDTISDKVLARILTGRPANVTCDIIR